MSWKGSRKLTLRELGDRAKKWFARLSAAASQLREPKVN